MMRVESSSSVSLAVDTTTTTSAPEQEADQQIPWELDSTNPALLPPVTDFESLPSQVVPTGAGAGQSVCSGHSGLSSLTCPPELFHNKSVYPGLDTIGDDDDEADAADKLQDPALVLEAWDDIHHLKEEEKLEEEEEKKCWKLPEVPEEEKKPPARPPCPKQLEEMEQSIISIASNKDDKKNYSKIGIPSHVARRHQPSLAGYSSSISALTSHAEGGESSMDPVAAKLEQIEQEISAAASLARAEKAAARVPNNHSNDGAHSRNAHWWKAQQGNGQGGTINQNRNPQSIGYTQPGAFAVPSSEPFTEEARSQDQNSQHNSTSPFDSHHNDQISTTSSSAIRLVHPANNQRQQNDGNTSMRSSGTCQNNHHVDTANLVTATPVDEDEDPSHQPLPTAEHVADGSDLEGQQQQQRRRQCRDPMRTGNNTTKKNWPMMALSLGVLIVVAVVIVGVSVFISKNPKSSSITNEGVQTNSTSTTSTIAPSTQQTWEEKVLALLPASTLRALSLHLSGTSTDTSSSSSSASPQTKALEWMLLDPNLEDYPDWRIQQRFALATLYYATEGEESWVNTTNWLSYTEHECQWYVFTYKAMMKFLVDTTTPGPGDVLLQRANHSNPCDGNEQGKFEFLWLLGNNLQGTTPPELFLLTSLRNIFFATNPGLSVVLRHHDDNVYDSLALHHLSNLEFLGVFKNKDILSPVVPTEIGLLSNSLLYLNLRDFQSSATLPTELGQLTMLKRMVLAFGVRTALVWL